MIGARRWIVEGSAGGVTGTARGVAIVLVLLGLSLVVVRNGLEYVCPAKREFEMIEVQGRFN